MKQSVKKAKLGPVGRLLKTAKQWTQGADARDKQGGEECSPRSPRATCWCLLGAMDRCYRFAGTRHRAAMHRLWAGINRTWPERAHVPTWNDKEGRTFAEVRKLLEETGV